MRQIFIIILLSLFGFSLKTKGQVELSQGFQQLEGYPYIICVDDVKNGDIELSDALFDQLAIGVQFKVNSTEIDRQSDFFRLYNDSLLPLLKREDMVLVKLLIRGAASPEGSYENNRRLGKGRTENLLKMITDDLSKDDLPNIKVETQTITEDYHYLVNLMVQNNDADVGEVRAIFEQCGWDEPCCKKNLMKMRGGVVWNRLLKQYFPRLRSSRIVLFFKPVLTGSPELSRDNLSQQLSKLSVQDTVLVYDNSAQKAVARKPRRELLSVKTNLLYDFAYMPGGYDKFCPIPNVAIEYYPMHGHFTFGASFDCPWWQDYDGHKYFQVRNYQLETRYYFRSGSIAKNPPGEGAAYRGLYLQAYGHAGLYGIMLSEKKGWVGEGAGAGLGIGYVLPLTKQGHWRLEFGAQFGYFLTKYDPFQWECPVDPTEHDGLYYYKWTLDAALFKERQYRFTWLGPTRVGLTLSWDIFFRKNKSY